MVGILATRGIVNVPLSSESLFTLGFMTNLLDTGHNTVLNMLQNNAAMFFKLEILFFNQNSFYILRSRYKQNSLNSFSLGKKASAYPLHPPPNLFVSKFTESERSGNEKRTSHIMNIEYN